MGKTGRTEKATRKYLNKEQEIQILHSVTSVNIRVFLKAVRENFREIDGIVYALF